MSKVVDLAEYKQQKYQDEKTLIEDEYQEFIRLLKYFVDIQEPKFDVVNIYLHKDEIFVCKNKNNKDITNEYIKDFDIEELTNIDDLLVSSLITSAPTKINIYNKENINQETVETLTSIFNDRIDFVS